MKTSIPRLTIGAATSGTGKTLFTSLLGRLLTQKGYRVQPFKCGPDYIDPSYHSLACGNISRNLDTRLIPEDILNELFYRQAASADISLIEGVMGLFDGAGALDERGSSSHLAKLLKSPVILLMDVGAMARSAAAIALGYKEFDPDLKLAGFILNRVASPRHEEMVRTAVENRTGLPVMGAIPRSKALSMPERHLGLVPAWEGDEVLGFLDSNLELFENSINLDAIIKAAGSAPLVEKSEPVVFSDSIKISANTPTNQPPLRIAYAWDKAFHFYYQDNLDLLKHLGVELAAFSPLKDRKLPENISGLYLGGGYPELFADELASNKSMMEQIRAASSSRMPIWAECGGLMYLSEAIISFEGRKTGMAGIIPASAAMKKGLRALGYYSGRLRYDSWMGKAGDELTGHVFHWSELTDIKPGSPFQLHLKKDSGSASEIEDGFFINNSWAGYMHIHFASNPKIVHNYIAACRRFAEEQKREDDDRRTNNQ